MREDLRDYEEGAALWVDKQGRVFLPVSMRKALGVEPGERMKVSALVSGRRVILVDLAEIAEGMAPEKPAKRRGRKRGKAARR